jgi:hypothetical protein
VRALEERAGAGNQERGSMRARFVLLFAALLLCAGCGTFNFVAVKDHARALEGAQPTHASVADLPFATLTFPIDTKFEIDEKSPVLDFGGDGKSYVKGFELPQREGDYQIVLRTYLLRYGLVDYAMYFPIVMLLDEDRKPVHSPFVASDRTLPGFQLLPDDLEMTRYREITQRITASPRVRYLVIRTSRSLIEYGGIAWNPPSAEVASAVIVPIYIPEGPKFPRQVEGSAVGRFRIQLEEIPH